MTLKETLRKYKNNPIVAAIIMLIFLVVTIWLSTVMLQAEAERYPEMFNNTPQNLGAPMMNVYQIIGLFGAGVIIWLGLRFYSIFFYIGPELEKQESEKHDGKKQEKKDD